MGKEERTWIIRVTYDIPWRFPADWTQEDVADNMNMRCGEEMAHEICEMAKHVDHNYICGNQWNEVIREATEEDMEGFEWPEDWTGFGWLARSEKHG